MAAKKSTKGAKSQSSAQTFRKILDEKVNVDELAQIKPSLEVLDKEMTRDEVIAISLVRKAMHGDLSAAKFIKEQAAAEEISAKDEKAEKFTLTLRVKEDGA